MQKNVTIIQVFLGTFALAALITIATLGYMFYSFSNEIWTNEDWQSFKRNSDTQFAYIDRMLKSTNPSEMSEIVDTASWLSAGEIKFVEKQDIYRTEVGREMMRTGSLNYISPPTSRDWIAIYSLSNFQYYISITKLYPRNTFIEHFRWNWLIIPVLVFAAALFLGVCILRLLVRKPIHNIVASAKALESGNFDIRANTNAIVPINRLADCFNSMAEDLQRTFVEKEMMLAAIPHELKTPLARLSFILEMGKTRKTEPEFIEVLSEIEDTVNELQSAVSEVLELTNLRDIESIETTQFSPHELCKKEIALLEEDARNKVELDVDPNLLLYGNCELLARAFQSVLGNSVRYADSKCLVTIAVESENAILRVEDDGFGVTAEHQVAVFEAFTKIDPSRSKNGAGLGLGLALVRVIMNKHGGTAKMKASKLGGACVEMQWPAQNVI